MLTTRSKKPRRQDHVKFHGGGSLTLFEEARLRRRLRRTAPSEPWIDAQFASREAPDGRGGVVVHRVHLPGAFPPGGSQTAMRPCPRCGVLMPPIAFEDGICLDHAEPANWGPSPSAAAIRGLQYRNLRMPKLQLPPESTLALQAEIDAYARRKNKR